MFESKINRGKANGYAPLDGSGKVPLSKLPPIQSTIETGSFATIGSNVFTGTQTISGSNDTSFTIGQLGYTSMGSFDLKVTGSAVSLTSDIQSVVGVFGVDFPFGDSSVFINQINGYPYSDGPMAGIGLNKSGSVDSKLWLYDYKGKSYIPGDVTIGYTDISSTTSSGSLNIRNGNINISGSFNFLNDSGIVKVVSGSYLIENISINPSGGELSNQQGGPYCLTVLKTDLPNADTIINIGDSVVDPNNGGVGHAIVTANVITFPDNIDYWAIPIGVVDPIVFTYENNTINISGPLFKVWQFDGSGKLLTPGDINISNGRVIIDGTSGKTANHWYNYPNTTNNWFTRLYSDNGTNLKARLGLENLSDITIETTDNSNGLGNGGNDYKWKFDNSGSLTAPGNINVSGSVNISSSLVVASSVVSNGSINAHNSDLIIDGGDLIVSGGSYFSGSLFVNGNIYANNLTGSFATTSSNTFSGTQTINGKLILSSSNIPTATTGSLGDTKGMLAIDDNFLYYNTSTYIPQITAGVYATAHAVNSNWSNDMYGNTTIFIQDDGINPAPQVGWVIQGSVNSATIVDTGYGVNHQNSGFGFMWLLQLNDIVSFNSDDSVTLIEQTGTDANWKRIAFESGSW